MLSYLLFRVFIFTFRFIPFRILYFFSSLLSRVAGLVPFYRKKVIEQNLSIAFPTLAKRDRKRIIRLSYQNLFDIVFESLKSFSYNPQKLKERYRIEIQPQVLEWAKEKQDLTVMAAHFGNWEWGALVLPIVHPSFHVIGLIKPMRNKRIHKYVASKRSMTGSQLQSIYDDHAPLLKKYERAKMIVYIADQNPSNKKKAVMVDFFNTQTPCLHGAQSMAKRLNTPVIHLKPKRVSRGYYTVAVTVLIDPQKGDSHDQLMQVYMSELEEMIQEQPQDWLWTHKRWKHSYSYK